jgi:transposase
MKFNKTNNILVNSIYNYIKKNNKKLYETYQFKTKNQKYKLKPIIEGCITFIKISSSWSNFNFKNIKSATIYKNYRKLNKYNIFKNCYVELLNKYLIKKTNKKICCVFSDTSVINNKYNEDKVKRNKYYKNKKVHKISIISDINGIPLNITFNNGNDNDITILKNQLQNWNINLDKKLNINFKNSIFMADAGYDSTILRNSLNNIFFKVIIPFNKRNTKDAKKIKNLTNEDKKEYKKRIKIENMFSKIKSYRRLNTLYEKHINNYIGFIYLSLIDIILKF